VAQMKEGRISLMSRRAVCVARKKQASSRPSLQQFCPLKVDSTWSQLSSTQLNSTRLNGPHHNGPVAAKWRVCPKVDPS